MKKGLLSLLAVALTVVSCQNYDDQFESLTEQITQLSTTVAGLTAITDQVTALQQTVNGLATASSLATLAGAVNDNATAIAAAGSSADAATAAVGTVADQVASVQASITAILADLDNVATAADLDTISATLAIVQADVKEILAGSAVVNQDVTITSPALLEYAESLISTDADDPNVIINGQVTIDVTGFTADELARTNAVVAKFATILGDGTAVGATKDGLVVTSTSPLTFTNLAFIDDNYTINGSDQDDAALRTVSGDLVTNYAGAHDYSQLGSVGNVVISNSASTTLVDFSGTTVTSIDDGAPSVGVLVFNGATSVDLGTAPFTSLTANAASSINVDATGFAAATTIVGTSAATIDLNAATSSVGLLTITGTGTTIIHADKLASADDITVTDSSESHFGALVQAGALTIAAGAASNFAALTDTDGASSIGGETVILTVLAAATGTLTLPDATAVNAPEFVGSTGNGITAPEALTVSVESIAAADLTAGKMTSLTITAQAENLTIANTTYPALTTITVDGKDVTAVTGLTISITSNATVTSVTVGGEVSVLTIAGNGHDTLVTSGNITTLNVTAVGLETATLGHTYLEGDDAISMTFQNTALSTLDMSSVSKVKAITITGNGNLTTVMGPDATTLPEAGAAISATMGTNSITAAYTDGKDAVGATETTPAIPAVEPIITSASINSILTWWNAAAANADTGVTTATSIDLANISYDNAGTASFGTLTQAYAADSYANGTASAIYVGAITTNAERAIVTE